MQTTHRQWTNLHDRRRKKSQTFIDWIENFRHVSKLSLSGLMFNQSRKNIHKPKLINCSLIKGRINLFFYLIYFVLDCKNVVSVRYCCYVFGVLCKTNASCDGWQPCNVTYAHVLRIRGQIKPKLNSTPKGKKLFVYTFFDHLNKV